MPTPSKLAQADWPNICDGLDQGQTQAALADGYGCSRQAISKLVNSPAFATFRQRRQVARQARRQREAGRERVTTGAFRTEQRGGYAERQQRSRQVHSDTIDPGTGKRFPNAREAAGLSAMPDESWADLEDAERQARGYRLAEVTLDDPAGARARRMSVQAATMQAIRAGGGILSNADLLQLATLSG